MLSQHKKILIFSELILFLLTLLFIIFNNLSFSSAIGVLLMAMIIPLFLIIPYYTILLLIIVRNTTDLYTESIFLNFFDVITLNFSSLLGVLVIFFGIITLIRKKIEWRKIPLVLPWLLFIIFSTVSIIYSIDQTSGIKTLMRLLSIFSVYIISFLYFQENKEKKMLFLKVLFISYLLPCLLGLYQAITQRGFYGVDGFFRINGTYFHPNSFAFNLFLAFIIFTTVYFNSQKKLRKKVLFYLIILMILILFTLTRSAWLGLILFILVLLLIYERKKVLKYSILAISLLFIFVILNNYTILRYFDWNTIPLVRRVTTSTNLLSSWEWRIKTWTQMTKYVYQSPFIGFGLDTYRFLRSKEVYDITESLYAHNDYLKILIELGALGLLLYLNLIYQTLKNILQKFINQIKKKNKDREYLIAFIGIFIIYLIAGVDNVLLATSLQWVLWIYIAYLLSR
jgi:O-antigen ligase